MPAILVHASTIELLSEDQRVVEDLRRLLKDYMNYAKLGALIIDLPYFENFFTVMYRHLRKKNPRFSPWGYIFHSKSPYTLGKKFIELCKKDFDIKSYEAKVAFICGYYSHLALDKIIHPLVINIVHEDVVKNGQNYESAHIECEKYQSLFFHKELFSYDLIGEPLFLEKIRIAGGNWYFKGIEDYMILFIQKGCLETFGNAPHKKNFKNWARGLYIYGKLMSSFLGKIEDLKEGDETKKEIYFDNSQFNFLTHFGKASSLSIEYINQCYHVLANNIKLKESFLNTIPDVDLSYPFT